MKRWIVLTCVLALANCAIAPVATDVIPIDAVINELKLELARYQRWNATRPINSTILSCGSHEPAQVVMTAKSAKVTLKTVVAQNADGGVTLGVIPIGTVTPKFKINAAASQTRSQEIILDLDVSKFRGKNHLTTSGYGQAFAIDKTLRNLKTSLLTKVKHALQPCLKPKTLKLTIVFAVSKSADATFDVDFHVVSLSSKFSGSQEDTQTLELNFDLSGTKPLGPVSPQDS